MSRLLLLLLSIACSGGANVCFAQDSVKSAVASLTRHCGDCHGGGAAEGGLDLDSLSNDLGDAAAFATWERIHDRIAAGEMPPPQDSELNEGDRQSLLRSLAEPLTEAHAATKGTVLRRLNRREYENTLNDLFGTHLDIASLLPEDGRSGEFDNVGQSLDISMTQLQRFLEAIDSVIDIVVVEGTHPPPVETIVASYADTRGADKFIGSAWHKLEDGAVVFYRDAGYPNGMLREANAKISGRYEVTVTGYAHQSDRPITFELAATTFARGLREPTFGYFSLAPGKPQVVTTEVWLDERFMIKLTPQGLFDPNNEIKKNGLANYRGPGLAIQSVTLRGPLTDEFPLRGHRLMFSDLERTEIEPKNRQDRKRRNYRSRFEIRSTDISADIERSLTRIAATAFRRPVSKAQVQPFVSLFESQSQAGAETEDAYLTAVAAIFCSPEFLYLQEPPGPLDDSALATRLAYFLTRTTPDSRLLELAAAGHLTSDPQALSGEVDRLLVDSRSERFIADFCDAWLNLRDIEFTSPDRDLFPEFDPYLQHSMLQETRRYFRHLIVENRPAEELVRSDYAMLNERLAEHYGVSGVDGPEIRRVDLPSDSLRGGFLSQAAVLKVSSNGTNTSPVVRGVYVTERLLGTHVPPPPPGVPGVEPDIRGATTLRELLAKHRDVDQCRACHAMIDPPGFALEQFDPIGTLRENFRSLGQGERLDRVVKDRKVRYRVGPPVDATGQWANGDKFAGYAEFRDQLAAKPQTLYRTLAIKLMTFATGRPMGFSDHPEIERIVARGEADGYRIGDLMRRIVCSEIFRNK